MDVLTKIADEIYRPSCGFSYRNVQKWVERVEHAAGRAGLTICDLKPLAETLGCEPELESVLDAHEKRACLAIAQALNWERTEFDTLDELLEELRERVKNHTEFVNSAYLDRALLGKLREKVLGADGAGDVAWTLATRDVGQMLLDSRDKLDDDLVELDSSKLEALRAPYNLPRTHNCRCVLNPVATAQALLHAGELYRDVTILLQTSQLVAWRDADGQEHCAKAHQVLIDPDEDGLAAAILSRIAGVEIASEHMAELRAQMAGGVK